jgi:6-phosphogluconolactonase
MTTTNKAGFQIWPDHRALAQAARGTITLPIIQSANQIPFLAAGEDKANWLAQLLAPANDNPLPAQLAEPTNGNLLWMVDRAAADQL